MSPPVHLRSVPRMEVPRVSEKQYGAEVFRAGCLDARMAMARPHTLARPWEGPSETRKTRQGGRKGG
eukprot:15449724-Alexandrium_andersonii.AAC.1